MNQNPYLIIKNEYGEMRAVISPPEDFYSDVCYSIDLTSDFDESITNIVLMALEAKGFTIGMLIKIEVVSSHRGSGHGRALLSEYMDKIVPNTDVDLLFARVDNRQQPGFSLQDFYERAGFEPVIKSSGDLLMVNKGFAKELKQLISEHAPLGALRRIEDESSMDL